ncbi:CobE protein [Hyphomicrobium nitrativorans NL23]|uniref:CobE protein n=1 Tax=Hyphomicrobium nitrativorans NL23 TaxID=1029756 RepID=V5SBB5_9HYPH|nr:cobalamin biosynthesis protein [Hyphomicrobium nitrativorans]AHB48201.1 CobE protein [Hyphomicrobium nitrativorans NL23]
MLVCGIGCRRGTATEDIEAAICLARNAFIRTEDIAVIATETSKANEPGICETAHRLGVTLVSFTTDEFQSVASRILTVSPAALKHKSTPSVAEAAALLAGGANARLLGPRVFNATTTCAFAVVDGDLR